MTEAIRERPAGLAGFPLHDKVAPSSGRRSPAAQKETSNDQDHLRRDRPRWLGAHPQDRGNYNHAVLLEGKEGWEAVGFCGRPDIAEKKRGEHPGSVVVECSVLGARAADVPESEVAEKSADQKIREAKVHVPDAAMPKRTVGSLMEELLMDEALAYAAIVDRVITEFPNAKTTVRSVASVAAILRKKGVEVPMRRRLRGSFA